MPPNLALVEARVRVIPPKSALPALPARCVQQLATRLLQLVLIKRPLRTTRHAPDLEEPELHGYGSCPAAWSRPCPRVCDLPHRAGQHPEPSPSKVLSVG
jgi:hypothetical protein